MPPWPSRRPSPRLFDKIRLDLWGAGRAADLKTFQFGPRQQVTDRHSKVRDVGTYALHVSCAWRVTSPMSIIVASRDRYYPSEKSGFGIDDANFMWDQPGANLCDERIAKLFDDHVAEASLVVDAITTDAVGGASIVLRQGFTLDIFPDDSLPDEHWRLLSPSTKTPHFVVTGNGIRARATT